MRPYRHKVTPFPEVGAYLLAHGIAPAVFLESIGLCPTCLLDTRLWIDRDQSLAIINGLAAAVGDANAGLHMGEALDLSCHGLWTERILAERDLRGALEAAVGGIGLIETGRDVTLRLDGQRAVLGLDFAGPVAVDPRQYLEATLVFMKRFVDLGVEPVPVEVHLTSPEPRDTSEAERLLGPRLHFGAAATSIVFDRAALALPIDRRKAKRSVRDDVTPVRLAAGTTAAVVRVLEEVVRYERPTACVVAEALRINLRTMQRRLALWGVTYEELLEDFRLHRALILLRDGAHTVTEAAFDLGYSDSAHFTRAFKRWTGCTPRRYQRTRRAVPRSLVELLAETPEIVTA